MTREDLQIDARFKAAARFEVLHSLDELGYP
jgi:hypothetical protein